MEAKSSQLQIRVSPRQKREMSRRARAAGLSLSAWVLRRALPPKREELDQILRELRRSQAASYPLASLSDLLAGLDATGMATVLAEPPRPRLPQPLDALVAAMVEHTAWMKGVPVPRWAAETPPLEQPYFASSLASLRVHLLTHSPPAFRRRNLFVDTTVGGRV